MSDEQAKQDFPDEDQRLGVCFSQWKQGRAADTDNIERRACVKELRVAKAEGDKPEEIVGYAAVFDTLSEPMFGFRERIKPGAFTRTLEDGDDIRALINHDPSQILGRTKAGTLTLVEDERGLRVAIRPGNTQAAKDITESIRRGDVDQMSFSFLVRGDKGDRWFTDDDKQEIRELLDVRLFDVSAVTYPAYEATTVSLRTRPEKKQHGAAVTTSGSKRKDKPMADPIEKLRDRVTELRESAQVIADQADKEGRDLTDEERTRFDDLIATAEKLDGDRARRERLQVQNERSKEGEGRLTHPADPKTGEIRAGTSVPEYAVARDVGRWGFRDAGEFFKAVYRGSAPGARPDARLEARAPTSYASEGVGSDGGFTVPPDFRAAIMSFVEGEQSLLGLCDQNPTSSSSITYPADIDTPWSSSGIQCYWEGEASQYTQSKPVFQQNTVRAHKLAALVGASEELLEDTAALGPYLTRKAGQKLQFKLNLAIVQGTGAGQPLGILSAPCTVSVAKVDSQTADTLTGVNIITMWSRCYAPSRAKAVWLINQDIETYLLRAGFAGLTDAGAAATGWGLHTYIPPGGLSATPYGTLLGRPVIPTEACETIGDKGDIILADMSQYCAVTKVGGIRSETSIHLWFDYDVTAFKFVMRVGGQPHWPAAIDKRDGSNTLSPFVTLDARA